MQNINKTKEELLKEVSDLKTRLGDLEKFGVERKNLEKKLKKTHERMELAMDAGEHGFWDWNLDTDDLYFSPRYFTMLGYEPGELPMKLETWANLMHPDDQKIIIPKVENYVKNSQAYEVEFRLKTKGGNWKWISGRGKSYEKDNDGISHRAVGVHVDITERKQAEEELKKHRDHLEELVKERTEEVNEKNKKLSSQMKIFVGRELKIRDLESKIRTLEKK